MPSSMSSPCSLSEGSRRPACSLHAKLLEKKATGSRSSYFSIGINHGGYFLGSGANRSYVNGHVIWYDNVDSATWSPSVLENIIQEIGYEMHGRIKVHYCIPMLSLSTNGLRVINEQYDTDQMVTFQSFGHNFISLYLDHDESLRAINWDDVVQFPVNDLPPVISPVKPSATSNPEQSASEAGNAVEEEPVPIQVVYASEARNAVDQDCVAGRTRMSKRKATVVELDDVQAEDVTDNEKDSDFDPEGIVDSDFEIGQDDDDLFQDNVDEEDACNYSEQEAEMSDIKGKQNVCKEENLEEEDLRGPDSDEETVAVRTKTFREIDLADPKFQTGLIFESVELLRRAITAYSCINRKCIKLPINDRKRVRAVCVGDCKWYMWASYDSISKAFKIKKYIGEHTCSSTIRI
ncbi:hypothetical protein ACQ4PT_019188 [Festuca glaucescens]